MLRLFLIRLFESFFRAPLLYAIPSVLFALAGVVQVIIEPTNYITFATIYVDSKEFTRTIRLDENFETVTEDALTTRSATELQALISSERFLDDVLSRIDLSQPLYYIKYFDEDELELYEHLQEAIEIYQDGSNQITIVVTTENPDLAVILANKIYEAYLDYKIARSAENYEPTEVLINDLINIYQAQVDIIVGELNTYLLTHPGPTTAGLDRRDIEVVQIERLNSAIDTAQDQLSYASGQQSEFVLQQRLSEDNLRKTYILIDAAVFAFELTTTTSKLTTVISFTILGAFLGIVLALVNALIGWRILLPVDIENQFGQRVLCVIPFDELIQSETRWQRLMRILRLRRRQSIVVDRDRNRDLSSRPIPSRKDRYTRR